MGQDSYNGLMAKFNLRDSKGRFVYRHGYSGTYLYHTWTGMMSRCYRKDLPAYKRYGGRGIEVYGAWHDAKVFIEQVRNLIGDRPTSKHSLDRINNDKGYEPDNIKWSTPIEQANNRRMPNTNTTGSRNVSFRKDINKFRVRVTVGGKRINLGNFNTLIEAEKAYLEYNERGN